jgi:hypothetical protein
MKCEFCGKETGVLYEGPEGVGICDACKKAYDEELAKGEKVIPINAENPESASPVKCEIVAGIREDSSIYFNIGGSNPDMLTIDGLIKFADRRMKQYWDARDVAQIKAAAEAAAASEVAEK